VDATDDSKRPRDASHDSTVDGADATDDTGPDDGGDAGDSTVGDVGSGDGADDGSDGEADSAPSTDAPAMLYTVGGTLSGLAAGAMVTLSDNGQDTLTLAVNGPFAFSTPLAPGATYAVTVVMPPMMPSQTCAIMGSSGTVGASNVTSVAVSCATTVYTVGGTLSGLPPGATIVLQDNGGDTLSPTGNGAFAFATPVASGSPYNVTVLVQPAGGTCVVSAGAGTVAGGPVTGVVVNCTAGTVTIGGTVSGLAPGDSIALKDNGADTLFITQNGMFAFPTPLMTGAPYAVTLGGNPTTPVAQTCTVTMGSGPMAAMNITSVAVACTTTSFTLGGTVTGLAPGDVVTLLDNDGAPLPVMMSGQFTFPMPMPSGATYNVTVMSQAAMPVTETCTVTAGSGMIGGANVTSVLVTCVPFYKVGGTIVGLAPGDTVNLALMTGSGMVVMSFPYSGTAAGPFTFGVGLASGTSYSVNVTASPTTPTGQTCTVTAGTTGTASPTSSTSITVTCTPSPLFPIVPNDEAFVVAVANGVVYWGDSTLGTINSVPVAGGASTLVCTGAGSPHGIAVDGSNVYWTDFTGSRVMKVNAGTSTVSVVAALAAGSMPWGIAVDAGYVYWTESAAGNVRRASASATNQTPQPIAMAQGTPMGIATDGTYAYWTNNTGNSVMKAPVGGGAIPTPLGVGVGPVGIAVNATSVYWTNSTGGTVKSTPITGAGPAVVLASGENTPYFLAIDANAVYWTDHVAGGSVVKAPLGGGMKTTLATGQNYPFSIAVDTTSVYFTDDDTSATVWKMPD